MNSKMWLALVVSTISAVHFHTVFLDGAYQIVGADAPVFRSVVAPESSDLQQLVEQIAGRIG